MSIKTSKSFIIQDELLTKGIVEIYKEILRGDIGKFPNGTWQRPDALENAKKCIKYSIEEIYKFSTDEIVEKVTAKFFQKNKLSGMLEACFNNSPFDAINTAYPRRFKPWEFGPVSNGYWTDETAKRTIKWLLEEKLKLTDDEIKEQVSQNFFKNNNLGGMLAVCFKGSSFNALNTAYPGKFKPWELKSTPLSYWNKNTAIEATKWLVEEKLKLTDEDLKEKLSQKLFYENNLSGMLTSCFHCSPFEAIDTAYPGKFKPWDFKRCPLSYWTRENGIKATKWLIEEKLKWSHNDIKEKLTNYIFVDNGLRGMLQKCFNNSPYEAINATYPGKFKKEDFKSYHISHRL